MSISTDELAGRVQQLVELDRTIKEAEAEKRKLREEFFVVATRENKQRQLPQRVIVIEHLFWQTTKISEAHFFRTRYPAWVVKAKKSDPVKGETEYLIERDAEYLPWSYVEPTSRMVVAKQVSEYQPEIDWVTLQKDRPDIFDKISRPKISYELDEQGFEKAVREDTVGEIVDVLSRHFIVKAPVRKLAPIRQEKDEE